MSRQAERIYRRRRLVNVVALVLSGTAALFGLAMLCWILWTTISKGAAALSPHLFLLPTAPPGEPGGLANALVGTVLICLSAVAWATPLGILAGTYLAEYANYTRRGATIRFVNDILLSAPSIVLGLFVYTLVVRPMEQFSMFAGVLALGFIVLPVVVRTTDEMLRMVPTQMREAALSLGIPQWKVTTQVLYRAARSGITTGVLLGLARISGETAPLIFTNTNNQYWSTSPFAPMSNLPMTIYEYAKSPFEDWQQLAWAGALLVTAFVLLISVTARLLILKNKTSHD
ncbi:phosphate ABC transporter permease PtsA [Ahniella affigens]|uniref:Phosphate transport system permease protein PstA n=1 Tax=Ahniella affigens TaxID=2021234 RepID=A0A2P1PT40_9GAMM|nr:phosphate ABC transporter permease PstA [Ahniella affigens]AVP98009.1 phosphate ABC transporter permease PtsA [Ahniella affigens]